MTAACVVLSVDPGLATGVALSVLYRQPHDLELPNMHRHELMGKFDLELRYQATLTWSGAAKSGTNFVESAHGLAAALGVPLTVVIEQFVITKTALQKNTTWSSEVSGMFTLATYQYAPDAALVLIQKPSQIKTLVHGNKALEQCGIKMRGVSMVDHEQDAIAHAMLYAARLSQGQARIGQSQLGEQRT